LSPDPYVLLSESNSNASFRVVLKHLNDLFGAHLLCIENGLLAQKAIPSMLFSGGFRQVVPRLELRAENLLQDASLRVV
jgi:hypothetical protein